MRNYNEKQVMSTSARNSNTVQVKLKRTEVRNSNEKRVMNTSARNSNTVQVKL